SEERFVLLQNEQGHQFIAQSGLVGPQGVDRSSTDRPTYSVSADSFTLADGQDELVIPMSYTTDGIEYVKTFTVKRGSYAIDVAYDIVNNSGSTANVGMYAHLRQNVTDSGGSLTMPT
ncbi:membrane protein insertase YidC, partial [Vibrio campbellii]